MSGVQVIQDAEFEASVLQSEKPVLVYFWAGWCGPCRLMSPMVEALANQFGDRLSVIKMEVDPNPESVKRCNVQGVPALVLFQNGTQVQAREGVTSKQQLEEMLAAKL